jgi:hypothetical protein
VNLVDSCAWLEYFAAGPNAAFFGRAKEMDVVMRALSPADRTWGVLVDGIGGIGKSALAIEAAHRAQDAGAFLRGHRLRHGIRRAYRDRGRTVVIRFMKGLYDGHAARSLAEGVYCQVRAVPHLGIAPHRQPYLERLRVLACIGQRHDQHVVNRGNPAGGGHALARDRAAGVME